MHGSYIAFISISALSACMMSLLKRMVGSKTNPLLFFLLMAIISARLVESVNLFVNFPDFLFKDCNHSHLQLQAML